MIWVQPKIKGVVGTEKLCGRCGTTVFSQHVHWCRSPIMDLKEVRVTVITCLQLEDRESNTQNLTGSNKTNYLFFFFFASAKIVYAVTLHSKDLFVHAAVRIYLLWSHYVISWKIPGYKKILWNLKDQKKGEKIRKNLDREVIWKQHYSHKLIIDIICLCLLHDIVRKAWTLAYNTLFQVSHGSFLIR